MGLLELPLQLVDYEGLVPCCSFVVGAECCESLRNYLGFIPPNASICLLFNHMDPLVVGYPSSCGTVFLFACFIFFEALNLIHGNLPLVNVIARDRLPISNWFVGNGCGCWARTEAI